MSINWLLLGANGQVGRQLTRSLQPLGRGQALTREQCDLSQPGDVAQAVAEHSPTVVINAAAYTAVDRAEEEPALAARINAEAVNELATACVANSAVLVHYSTDYVFDGHGSRPFLPDETPAPLSVYGSTKLAGEQAIQQSGARYLILRTSWVYDNIGHNFINTMLRLAAVRDHLRVVHDQVGAPTWAATLADVTSLMLHDWSRSHFDVERSGVYHLCPRGEASWYEVAESLFDEAVMLGLLDADQRPQVDAISSSEFPQKASRPHNSRLDITSLETVFQLQLPHWRDALKCSLKTRLT